MLAELDQLAGVTSSTFLRLHADQVRAVVDNTLSQLVDLLDVQCVSLSVCSPGGNTFDVVHASASAGMSQSTSTIFTPCHGAPVSSFKDSRWSLQRGHGSARRGGRPSPRFRRHHGQVSCGRSRCLGGRMVYALAASSSAVSDALNGDIVQPLRLIVESMASAIHRAEQESSLHQLRTELDRLTGHIGSENTYLREKIDHLQGFHEIIGESTALRESLARVLEVAPTDATVLLTGDTGTGKELFARALHERSTDSSARSSASIALRCPRTLIESELFGHERGAFTGAVNPRFGRFETADKGTLFLDEIGDLPLELQAKLLRVLQEGEFERLGSSQTRRSTCGSSPRPIAI